MPPITILVVDDFEPFRRFACPILEREAGLCIIGEASDGLEAVQKIEELQPDLILLDIGLPGLNGIEVARRVGKLAQHGSDRVWLPELLTTVRQPRVFFRRRTGVSKIGRTGLCP